MGYNKKNDSVELLLDNGCISIMYVFYSPASEFATGM